MRYNPNRKPTISPDKFEKFKQYHGWALAHQEQLKDKEVSFVADMTERLERWGDRTYVSEAQYDWMEQIAGRVG